MSGPKGGASVRGPLSAPAKAVNLLRRADGLLSEAAGAPDPAERFCTAYVGALRGAAAVLAASEGTSAGGARRPRSRSAWVLMARAEPGFGAWADYFAGYSGLRADLEAGITRAVDAEEVDSFYAEVGRFLFDVEDLLGR
ncbi:SAV_6107 family HEPN domain-containing protein [Prescottella equi]|uniref:SAV_6107 family HEPN domain-containing protein n=1 Tax=Rhodococcus hoagii TaxID=43767 RepID=UPI0007CD5644